MGDMNDNLKDGKESGSSQFTPDNRELSDSDMNSGSYERPDFEYQAEQPTYEETPYEQSFETAQEQSSGKKTKPKFIAAVIIIAVLIAGSVLAFASRGTLANTIALMTKSPLEYYSGIEKKTVNKGIDSLTEAYDKYITLYKEEKNSGIAQDTNVKITVNPQFTAMIGLSDFKSIEAKISSLSKGNNGKASIGISYNDQSLVTVNTLVNSETGELFASIPELSSAYLLFSLDDLMSYSGDTIEGYNYSEYVKEIEKLLNSEALSPDTLNSLLKKYSALIIDNIDNMKLDKNVSVTASELTGTYNMLTSELNGEDIYNITAAILNEAKNDETVKNLFVTLKICTEEEYPQLVDNALTELNNGKASMTASAEPLSMRVYVDKSGRIMGRELVSSGDAGGDGAGYYIVSQGNKISLSTWIKQNGENVLDFTADGSVSAKGFNGNSVLSYSEFNADYGDYTTYSFNIAVENAKLAADKGFVNGKFTVTSDTLMGTELILDCKSGDQQQSVKFQVLYGGIDAAAVDITSQKGTYQDFEFPSSKDQVFDGLNDIYSYMGTADFEGLLTHVEEVTGLDLSSLFGSLLFNSAY